MQTTYTRDSDKFEIKIEFPQEKFHEYLKQVGATKTEELNKEQMVKLLGIVFEDYKRGTISLDGLSVIANELFDVVVKLPDSDELVLILEEVADLAYQERLGDFTKGLGEFLAQV